MNINHLLKIVRQYFWSKKFTEVEIPYLNPSLPLEPNIYSLKTTWQHKNIDYFLPTSPEFALKNFITKNKRDCFAISHCFRDLENSNSTHTPEFLMLEWYEINKNLNDLQISVQNFVNHFLPKLKFKNIKIKETNFDNEPNFNQYFLNKIEPNLLHDCGIFITGYPAFLSPLAKPKFDEINNFSERSECEASKPEGSEYRKNLFMNRISNRFELYINGIEIANGCEENRDSNSITKSFLQEQEYRLKNQLPLHPISPNFAKMCSGIPPCSGIGVGIKRLLRIINDHGIRF